MLTKPPPDSWRRTRRVVFVHFCVHGAITALWIVAIPAVKAGLGLGDGALGLALFTLAASAVLTVRIAGPVLLRRFSPARVSQVCGLLAGLALVLPGVASTTVGLAIAVLPLGAGLGLLDLAMNAYAGEVEAAYGRPVMSSFHGAWSLATLTATALGGAAVQAGVPLAAVLGCGGLLLGAACGLVRHRSPTEFLTQPRNPVSRVRRATPRRVWVLAALALSALMCEGAVGDWSGVWLVKTFDIGPGLAASGYGAFAITATAGRFLMDRIARRVGPVALLRVSGVVVAGGIGLAIAAAAFPVSIAGWAVAGAGSAGIVPQVYSAAARMPHSAAAVAQVSSAAYLGTVISPPVIAWIATTSGLGTALLFLLVPALVVVVAAPACRSEAAVKRWSSKGACSVRFSARIPQEHRSR
ncbi:MFS transporter [Amycolatopsis sp. NPDC059021]|uniref:MFS transporter n=1 Tax=Amycolatopsis sp. NPDC059021 TaxID=3346704 RepID=UPI00366FE8B0